MQFILFKMLSQYSWTVCASGKIEARPMMATGVSRSPPVEWFLLADDGFVIFRTPLNWTEPILIGFLARVNDLTVYESIKPPSVRMVTKKIMQILLFCGLVTATLQRTGMTILARMSLSKKVLPYRMLRERESRHASQAGGASIRGKEATAGNI
jgi:hypothetical protein